MGVSLDKGGNMSLTNAAVAANTDLRRVIVACGWNPNRRGGPSFDLDLSAAGLDATGRLPMTLDDTDEERRQEWFVWANHRSDSARCIIFGDVDDAFIRVYDAETCMEFARFDLDADFSDETLVIFGELYRRGGEWKFRAIGQGYDAAVFRTQHGIADPFEVQYARYAH